MFLLAERHAESLLDICHDTNSSPTDMMTVTKNQNIILQSIGSSEVRCSNLHIEKLTEKGITYCIYIYFIYIYFI